VTQISDLPRTLVHPLGAINETPEFADLIYFNSNLSDKSTELTTAISVDSAIVLVGLTMYI
jgi:hypothetical protein